MIVGKFSSSQRIKTKQVFIVDSLIGKSDEEEEGKVIATILIISYGDFEEKKKAFLNFFLCFDYFLFISQEAILSGVKKYWTIIPHKLNYCHMTLI